MGSLTLCSGEAGHHGKATASAGNDGT